MTSSTLLCGEDAKKLVNAKNIASQKAGYKQNSPDTQSNVYAHDGPQTFLLNFDINTLKHHLTVYCTVGL